MESFTDINERFEKYLGLLNGIKKLHERGFVHGDIKPDNIMSNRRMNTSHKDKFEMVLIDFGVMSRKGDSYKKGPAGVSFPGTTCCKG